MAYRRLPNTDKARIRVLKILLERLENSAHSDMISSYQLIAIKELHHEFSSRTIKRQQITELRKMENQRKKEIVQQLKLSISHFFQVLNFAIIRGEIDKVRRNLYQQEENTGVIPGLNSESQIQRWGKIVVRGEEKRIAFGEPEISHPHYKNVELLLAQLKHSKQKLEALELELNQLQESIKIHRTKLDELIKKTWDDIEFYFKDKSKEDKRELAANYGVVYVNN